jgi:addiction module HigA family antidote
MRKPARPPKDLVSEVVTERTRENPHFPALVAETEDKNAGVKIAKKPPRVTVAELRRRKLREWVRSARSYVYVNSILFNKARDHVDVLEKNRPPEGTIERTNYDNNLQLLRGLLEMMDMLDIMQAKKSYRNINEIAELRAELLLEQKRNSTPKEAARSNTRLSRVYRTTLKIIEAAAPDRPHRKLGLVPKNLPPHPGEILLKEFLEPLGLTRACLAKKLGVTTRRIDEIVRGRRSITPETARLLAGAFDISPQFWRNLQLQHDFTTSRPRKQGRNARPKS